MDLSGQRIAKGAVGEVTVKTGVGGGRQHCGIKVCYSHPRAFRHKSGCERLPDTARSARDQNGLAFKPHVNAPD
jgi:hypothetical protein